MCGDFVVVSFVLFWLFVCLLFFAWFLLFKIILVLPSFFFPSNFARELSSASSTGINYGRSLIFGITQ